MTFQLAKFLLNHKYFVAGDYNSEATEYQEYAISSKTKYQDFEKALIKTNVRDSSSESGPTFTETSKGKTDLYLKRKKLSLHAYLVLKNKEFTDQAEHGIVDVVGDDKAGRKIIVVSACKFPANKDFDNQRFLKLVNHFV